MGRKHKHRSFIEKEKNEKDGSRLKEIKEGPLGQKYIQKSGKRGDNPKVHPKYLNSHI